MTPAPPPDGAPPAAAAAAAAGRRSAIVLRPAAAPPEEDANAYSTSLDSNARKLDALKKNPLVPAGAAATGLVLMAGLFAFKSGNAVLSQRLMRARIIAQGATLGVLAASVAGGVATKADAAEGDRAQQQQQQQST